MQATSLVKFILVTIVCFIFSYYCAFIIHEYGHSIQAWLLNEKYSPFDITYDIQGSKGWLLERINENVNYDAIFLRHEYLRGALIGASGVLINLMLAVIFLLLLRMASIQKNVWAFSVCYWGMVMNWMLFFAYAFYLGLNAKGDFAIIAYGLRIASFWVKGAALLIAFSGIYLILRYEIIKAYALYLSDSLKACRFYLVVTLITLFYLLIIRSVLLFFFIDGSFIGHGFKISVLTLCLIAAVIAIFLFVVFDPQRKGMKHAIQTYKRSKRALGKYPGVLS